MPPSPLTEKELENRRRAVEEFRKSNGSDAPILNIEVLTAELERYNAIVLAEAEGADPSCVIN